MNKHYILIVEESIKTFSIVGHGNECKFTFASKGQTAPFSDVKDGDLIIGYISNEEKRFAYLFEARKGDKENECNLIKQFETAAGLKLPEAPEDIQNVILTNEQTESFIEIDKDIYDEIVSLMLQSTDQILGGEADIEKELIEIDEKNRKKCGCNILLYGVPGCGKSYTIDTFYCRDADGMERVVFHPDYTYADFVGQIMPRSKGKRIEYEFIPGPFTNILRAAYMNPEKKYALIIEELNRGNAPAIFGDIFQLLDRTDSGGSRYAITNTDIAKIVYRGTTLQGTSKILIPSNLCVYATMNTSDQNVFTLDTAFQRRWRMRIVENDVKKAKTIANEKILDSEVTWAVFNEAINAQIITLNVGMSSSEDKRLGAYFVALSDLLYKDPEKDGLSEQEKLEAEDANHNFPEKVLKYLWDDAFKFTRDQVFKQEYDSLEKLIKAFEKAKGNDRFDVFLNDLFGVQKQQ